MKSVLSCTLMVCLVGSTLPVTAQASMRPVLADAETKQTEKVKSTIASIRSEQAVTVEMRDGTKVKGYIRDHLEESFTLIDKKALQATTIAFGDVAKVDKGRRTVTKVIIWTGAIYGTLLGLGAIIFVAGYSGS